MFYFIFIKIKLIKIQKKLTFKVINRGLIDRIRQLWQFNL